MLRARSFRVYTDNMKRIALALIMLVFAAAGFAQADTPSAPPQGQPGQHMGRGGEFAGLGLTEAQHAQIKAIRESYRPKIKAMVDSQDPEKREKVRELRHEMRSAVEAVLTPDQLAQFKARQHERGEHQGQRPPQAPEAFPSN